MNYVQAYNIQVRRVNAYRRAIDAIDYDDTLGELGLRKKKPKLTKAEKKEKKRLQKLEKVERLKLYKLTSKKERKKMSRKTKKAKRRLTKQLKKGTLSGFVGALNKRGAATLPLTEREEALRQAVVVGDFLAADQIAPFGPANLIWLTKTSIGKYRFTLQNGKPVYVPWTEQDYNNYLNGPWHQKDPKTGLARLIHPRRKVKIDQAGKLRQMWNKQEKAMKKFAPTDYRHIGVIEPGTYTYKHGITSTWVKIRAPVMIAVAIVASVYLGPAILQAVQAAYAKAAAAIGGIGAGGGGGAAAGGAAAGGGGAAAGGGGLAAWGSKVFEGAKELSGYVNNARTVKAIVDGDEIPPPVGVSGDNFGDWALKVGMDKAAEEYGRKLTKDEENAMRREIAQLQNQLQPYVQNVPLEIPRSLPAPIQRIQVIEKEKEDKQADMMKMLIPAAVGFLVLKGVA